MRPRIKRRGEKLTEARLAEVEAQFGIRLPADYRAFMLENNGGRPVPSGVCRKQDPTPDRSCACFLAIDSESGADDWISINHVREGTEPVIPRRLFMIAEDLGGNKFCLSVSGEDIGKVYWWDQEDGFVPMSPHRVTPDMTGMRLMADSFEAFLNQFAEDPDDPTPKPKDWEDLIEARDLKGVSEWLRNGGKLDDCNETLDTSPLMLAIAVNCFPIVELLLDHGAEEQEVLEIAVQQGRWRVLRSILKRAKRGGLQISPQMLADTLQNCDDVSVVRDLLDAGAPLQSEHFGLCPIYWATSFKSDPEIIKLLLDRGAKLDQSAAQNSPLVGALHKGNLETVKLLLDAGEHLYKVPQKKTPKVMKYEAQLEAEESKPKPNPSQIKVLNHFLEHERKYNSPEAPICAFHNPSINLPAAFKEAVIEYAARLGQKPE
jgi:ankyrin repeat protein